MSAPLLDVRGLAVEFDQGARVPPLRAVDGVDLHIEPGETLGLVGESGSGKSTIGRAVLGLVPANEGSVTFDGRDITNASGRERRALSADMQVIFQDPYGSLNPVKTIAETLAEPLTVHRSLSNTEKATAVRDALERVGLPAGAANRYPAHFSGGQRQRIAIARALMLSPRLVICDEPVSALDLSIQAQVLNLLHDLQEELGLSYLFIAHDLGVVRYLSDRIVVLYRGRVMEEGPAAQVYDAPGHPYTRALLAAAPVPDPAQQRDRRAAAAAAMRKTPDARPAQDPESCPFTARCPFVIDVCHQQRPRLLPGEGGTVVACHRYPELESSRISPQPSQPFSEAISVAPVGPHDSRHLERGEDV